MLNIPGLFLRTSATRHDAPTTNQYLRQLFEDRYQAKSLSETSIDELKSYLTSRIGVVDDATESYVDASRQRDYSRKYAFGHNHDFGDGFKLEGWSADRHIDIPAHFVDTFGLPRDLTGKRVLDIGATTGGMSLMLCAMGATEVVALEEVVKYAETVNYLARSFGIDTRLKCYPRSLFDMLPMFADYFDIVIYSGVVYHVSDPLLSLRLIFAALKDGGQLFMESYAYDSPDCLCRYEGPNTFHRGTQEELNRSGWNYFAPSPSCLEAWCRDVGFQNVTIGPYTDTRIHGRAERQVFQDFCRAGVSRPLTR